MEALGGQWDFSRDALALRKHGVATPLRVTRTGSYILSVVDFGKVATRSVRDPVASASFFEIVQMAPDLSNGGSMYPTRRMVCTIPNLRVRFQLARR